MPQSFLADLRNAFRVFKASPLNRIAIVLTLGAATGMNVAIFAVVERALLSPPRHVAHPESLYSVTFDVPGGTAPGARMTTASYVAFRALRDDVSAFSGAAAWQQGPANVVVDGDQVDAQTLLVSEGYFEVLGAVPQMGRGMARADGHDQSALAVLSHSFWMSEYGGSPSALGRRLTAGGIEYEIAGVMPRGFSGHSTNSVDVWLPIAAAMRANAGWDQDPFRNVVSIVARVATDSDVAAATAQAAAVLGRGVALTTLTGSGAGSTERRIVYWLAGVSVLVLAIGLANAGTLLLVQAAHRQRELVIRAALGATRMRLFAQVFTEGAVLAGATTAVSLLWALWLDEAVRGVLLPGLVESHGLENRTVLAAAVAGLVTALVAGCAGAYSLPRSANESLGEQRAAGRTRTQTALLIFQTGVSVLLLACAGMFGRSLYNLIEQDFGMQMEDVLLVNFDRRSNDVPGQDRIYTEALERVRALPGVQVATKVNSLPFGAFHVPPIGVPGQAQPPQVGQQLPFLIAATPELFDILGIRITEGRGFTHADDRGELVIIVNETMARTVWPRENAVGKCIRIGFDDSFDPSTATGPPVPSAALPCRRIVGVARDVRQRSVIPTGNEDRLMQYYVPFSQVPPPPGGVDPGVHIAGLLVRTAVKPSTLITPIRRLVLSGRADLPYLMVRPYHTLIDRQVRPWRVGTTLLSLFAALALAVAAMGLYAAFAHAVAVRRPEMAIRVAIGATSASVTRMILSEAATIAGIGIAAGGVAAVLAGRSLESMLYGIVPGDPAVLATAAALMLIVTVGATFFPARTASRTNPSDLLRAE